MSALASHTIVFLFGMIFGASGLIIFCGVVMAVW
jgi:hypothetical protein